MKTEHRKGHMCFFMSTGGGDFKYYKILDEQDMLEEAIDERTGEQTIQRVNKDRAGNVRIKEITSEEYYRMRKEEWQRERRGEL